MIQFTDPKLYVKGICSAQAKDPVTGDILFSSNKFTTGNITFSVNSDPLRAGLGNPIATIVESDPDITVNFTMANFDMIAKMAAVGGTVANNGISPVCVTTVSDGTSLDISLMDNIVGVPTAPYGYDDLMCYVQKVGEASNIGIFGTDGIAIAPFYYDPDDAEINILFPGIEAGATYKVWFYVKRPSNVVGTINSMMNGRVVNFEAQMAVYSNVGGNGNQGTRVGWLYLVVPRLKLTAEGGALTGDNSNYDTTVISGRAVSMDETVVSATCSACATSDLAYYIYAPDETTTTVTGIFIMDGEITAKKSTDPIQVQPYLAFSNGTFTTVDPKECSYTLTGAPANTHIDSSGTLYIGDTAGDCTLSIEYTNMDSPTLDHVDTEIAVSITN